ncbi:hypothetical protein ABV409_03540 [Flagellimonas sp. DF-77]|uniref:hypothetical protein n=1 Tax=Flagellimonas algarum TaxID=3230298 RepID=UPI00339AD1C4
MRAEVRSAGRNKAWSAGRDLVSVPPKNSRKIAQAFLVLFSVLEKRAKETTFHFFCSRNPSTSLRTCITKHGKGEYIVPKDFPEIREVRAEVRSAGRNNAWSVGRDLVSVPPKISRKIAQAFFGPFFGAGKKGKRNNFSFLLFTQPFDLTQDMHHETWKRGILCPQRFSRNKGPASGSAFRREEQSMERRQGPGFGATEKFPENPPNHFWSFFGR